VINRGYPHLKISKSGTKTDLIRRIIATNNLLEACEPTKAPAHSSGAAQDHEQHEEDDESKTAARPYSKKEDDTPPAAAASLKRKRVATAKSVYIDLINRYNSSQIDGYDPQSGTKLLRLSAYGNAQTLKERLEGGAGVVIPASIADYVFIGDEKVADFGSGSATAAPSATSSTADDHADHGDSVGNDGAP